MPSSQTFFLRQFSHLLKSRMESTHSLDGWRNLSQTGSSVPLTVRGVRTQWVDANGVPAEWLEPEGVVKERTILFIHGGGWVLGYYNPHRLMFGRIAQTARARALALDYRLAPEHSYPAAVDDCLSGYRYLLEQGVDPHSLVLAGNSAGGNLVLAALLALRDAGDPLPAAAVLMSPATDLTGRGPSYQTNINHEALLPLNFVDSCVEMYLQGANPNNPFISPLLGDLRDLPPLLIQAGGGELLLSDATRFAEKARQAGLNVTLEVYPGMWHVWQSFAPYLPEARQALESIAKFVQAAA